MLQGSLDNFALDEVLGLLSSTMKTGKLDLKGNRGSGMLRLLNGRLVDATASNTANGVEPEDVLFELLRFGDGTFNFTSSEVEDGSYTSEVQDVVGSAERRLADWRTIEAVVPSLRHRVAPVPTLADDEINITRQEWTLLMMTAAGCPVSTVCDELSLGEVEGSRQIKGLAERGLLTITDPITGAGFRRPAVDSLRPLAAVGSDPVVPTPAVTVLVGDGAVTGSHQRKDDAPAARLRSTSDSPAAKPPHPAAGVGPSIVKAIEDTNGDKDPRGKVDSSSHGGLLMRYLKSDD